MILSMTGFARERINTPQGELIWEIRTVNHRHLDLSLKLPEALRDLDPLVRDLVRQGVSRGKIDVTLNFNATTAVQELKLNLPLVQQLLATSEQVTNLSNAATPLATIDILRWPGVLQSNEADMDVLRQEAMTLLSHTIKALNASRKREGEKITAMLQSRLQQVGDHVQLVHAVLPEIQRVHQEKIQQRFTEAKLELDQTRLEQEMLLLMQRTDVAEELDRLTAHCQEMQHNLVQGGAIGRRLDFLMQEFNREANTLGSKSISPQTTKSALELKVLIEQMREQIQNIE